MMSELRESCAPQLPTRPSSLTVDLTQSPDGIAITTRQARGAGGGFLLLWLIMWTVGCVFLAGTIIADPSLGTIMFAVPFFAAWLAVATFLVWSFFGTETLLVRRDRVMFLRKAFVQLTARSVSVDDVRQFCTCRSSYQENDCYLWGIEVTTIGKPIRFGFRIPQQERLWLIAELNAFLELEGPVTDAEVKSAKKRLSEPSTSATRLTRANVLSEAPDDCGWQCEEDSSTVEFFQQGRIKILSLLGLLFINAFWNGIVSVFVLALWGWLPVDNGMPQGIEWWGMFVFLIPFEVIGLAMFVGLIAVLAEPFRQTTWKVDQQQIKHTIRWPMFRWSRVFECDAIDRLELRQNEDDDDQRNSQSSWDSYMNTGSFDITFVDQDNADVCTISGLTEGEARWMGGQMMECHSEWH
jgi:hypothetical protein